ncbi:hypothetical protein [Patiriisocius marinistellae]|uniref:hypothetical protein n=1 Tax=Patiriisocius marinistellae TaxID=2494560 RepID=UPI001562DB51|nr:hypothetical protein [Patiriisocius marinistellae]
MNILEPSLIEEHRFFFNQLFLGSLNNIDDHFIDDKPVSLNTKKVKQLISA